MENYNTEIIRKKKIKKGLVFIKKRTYIPGGAYFYYLDSVPVNLTLGYCGCHRLEEIENRYKLFE